MPLPSLDDPRLQVPVALVVVLLLVVVGGALLLGVWLARRLRGRRSRARNLVALRGEREAESLLREEGYAIVERQAVAPFFFEIDGEVVEVEVRADLIVQRAGRLLVAEVKTGAVAPDPCHPPTRRQLLEYALAFGSEELLLVDVEAARVHVVRFPRVSGVAIRRRASA